MFLSFEDFNTAFVTILFNCFRLICLYVNDYSVPLYN